MQKVSKQSLAMIALSILLAISIALTFTFALLTDSKTATGTIKFSGSGSLSWSGFKGITAASSENITFSLDESDYQISSDGSSAGLKNNWWSNAKVTFANGSSKNTLYYRVNAAWKVTGCVGATITVQTGSLDANAEGTATKDVLMTSVLGNLNLSDLDAEKMQNVQTLVITAEFNYGKNYSGSQGLGGDSA